MYKALKKKNKGQRMFKTGSFASKQNIILHIEGVGLACCLSRNHWRTNMTNTQERRMVSWVVRLSMLKLWLSHTDRIDDLLISITWMQTPGCLAEARFAWEETKSWVLRPWARISEKSLPSLYHKMNSKFYDSLIFQSSLLKLEKFKTNMRILFLLFSLQGIPDFASSHPRP